MQKQSTMQAKRKYSKQLVLILMPKKASPHNAPSKRAPKIFSLISDHELALQQAKKCILSGGILIYPTDTLYGIGCNALSKKAVAKIYKMKKREAGKPLSVIMADLKMMRDYCEISPAQAKILLSLLPGPYTFILKLKKPLPASPTLEIGIRVPEHIFMRQISKELSLPIVTTSANLSGKKHAASVKQLDRAISKSADLIIDGGKCIHGKPSTVIDLIRMKIVRKGAVRKGDTFEWD